MNTFSFFDHKCKCGKLLLRGALFNGLIEIKCKKCGFINKIDHIKIIDDESHYVAILNNNGIITKASQTACNILGYSYGELVGKHFTYVNSSVSKEIYNNFLGPDSVLNEDNYFIVNSFHNKKDGTKIPVRTILKYFENMDNEKCILSISEVKNSIDYEKVDNNFLDNSCDFYFDIDKDGLCQYMSLSVEKYFGFKQDVCIGRNYLDNLPSQIKKEAIEKFKYFSSKKLPYKEVYHFGEDLLKNPINCELYFTPKNSDFGKFIGYRISGWIIKPKS